MPNQIVNERFWHTRRFSASTRFWHAWWDTKFQPEVSLQEFKTRSYSIAGKEVKQDNVIPVTMEDLTEEQKQQVEQNIANFQKLCLESFGMTRQGPIQKSQLPKPVLVGESSLLTPKIAGCAKDAC